MLTKNQIEYLYNLENTRLLEYLKARSVMELDNIIKSLRQYFISKEPIEKEKRAKCETAISYVQAHLNGLKQTEGKEQILDGQSEEKFIDTSKFKPLTANKLIDVLGLTIKKDNENKEITFLGMLSTYTKDAQFNISFNAPSSSGKSYIPTEVATLFPQDDVMEVGYCSPTAFFHDRAKEYNKEKNELIVDFTGKIIIFLDQPHTLLLQHLRPLLSHDKYEIRLKITDKSQKGGLRTKNVVLRGFPAVIFCTAGLTVDEQESTRFILLSPEINQEKIREAILERIKKSSDNLSYKYFLETNTERQLLKERILAIKQEEIDDIVIKTPELIEKTFFDKVKILKPRHQRDMGRIISMIKVFALLNVWFRNKDGSSVIATEEDIREAFKLWNTISEAQELNIPPYVFNLYKDIIVKAYQEKNYEEIGLESQGISRNEVLKKHNEVYGRALSDWTLRKEIIPMLEASGLIVQESDKIDKRKMLISPTTLSTISLEQNNSGTDGVVNEEIGDTPIT